MRLGDDARFLRDVRGERMIEVVRVGQRVGQHECRPQFAIDVHEALRASTSAPHRVIADSRGTRSRAPSIAAAARRLVPPVLLDARRASSRHSSTASPTRRARRTTGRPPSRVQPRAAYSAMAPPARQTKSAECALTTRTDSVDAMVSHVRSGHAYRDCWPVPDHLRGRGQSAANSLRAVRSSAARTACRSAEGDLRLEFDGEFAGRMLDGNASCVAAGHLRRPRAQPSRDHACRGHASPRRARRCLRGRRAE